MAVWKQIKGYPDYWVSDEGEIISTVRPVYSKRKKQVVLYKRNLKIKPTRVNGYCCVTIGRKSEGTRKTFKVHRLVAEAFCEKRHGCTAVNHIDGNKMNNNAWNLEWCNDSENQKHAYATGLSVSTQARRLAFATNRKDNSVSITVRTPDGKIEQYPSLKALADKIGIDPSGVSRAYKNMKSIRGYEFTSYHGIVQ